MHHPPEDEEARKKRAEEAIRKAIDDARKETSRFGRSDEPTPREGVCYVCKGKVTETFSKQFDPSTGPMIIGPGSYSQFRWVSSGLHCLNCGIKYAKLPPIKTKKRKAT